MVGLILALAIGQESSWSSSRQTQVRQAVPAAQPQQAWLVQRQQIQAGQPSPMYVAPVQRFEAPVQKQPMKVPEPKTIIKQYPIYCPPGAST